MPGETRIGGDSGEFPQTRWTRILSSRERPEARHDALCELLALYWKPLYFYARRKGRNIESAKDLIQDFFAHLLERDFLSRLDPSRGRFRGYLRTSLDNFMANLHESQSAKKRGGGARVVALDFQVAESDVPRAEDSAEAAYDREWALEIMERAMGRLRTEFEQGTRRGPFELALSYFRPGTPPSYEEAAHQSGMTVSQFKAFLHRARVRFRALVREEVLHTVPDASDADAEMAELMRALRS
jgi:RNA polymerase sigma-70 factor (ECF subfamily)